VSSRGPIEVCQALKEGGAVFELRKYVFIDPLP